MRLPKLDTIIIGVFFVCIALWMTSKCGSKRSDYVRRSAGSDPELEERPVRRDTVRLPTTPVPAPQPAPVTVPTPVTTTTPQPAAQPQVRTSAPANPGEVRQPVLHQSQPQTAAPAPQTAAAAPPAAATPKQTMLYVTIDQLKMRKEPGLKGKSIGSLDLYSQVYYTGQRTDWTQEISLGLEKVKDRWVKIRTKEGKEGWVFGAGVNYYKEKRKGVLE